MGLGAGGEVLSLASNLSSRPTRDRVSFAKRIQPLVSSGEAITHLAVSRSVGWRRREDGLADCDSFNCSCTVLFGSSPILAFHSSRTLLYPVSMIVAGGRGPGGNSGVSTVTSHPNRGRYFMMPVGRIDPASMRGGQP